MRLTTAMTAATPITTPMSVRALRSLCAQRLEAEIATASEKFIVDGRAISVERGKWPHPIIRIGSTGVTGDLSRAGSLEILKENGRPEGRPLDCRFFGGMNLER